MLRLDHLVQHFMQKNMFKMEHPLLLLNIWAKQG